MLARRISSVKGLGKAVAFGGRLRHTPDALPWIDAQGLQHGVYHVDGVGILGPHLAAGLDALEPGDDEWVADAATIGLALPTAEGRVAGKGLAPGVLVEVFGAADLIDGCQVLLQAVRHFAKSGATCRRRRCCSRCVARSQEAILKGNIAVVAGITGRDLGDARHVVGVMVAIGEHARAGARAEGRGMHVVAQTVGRQGVHVGGVNQPAKRTQVARAGIVDDDKQDIR